jgi:hypothetical protein
VELALLAVLRGGALHALADLLVRHPSRRVRGRLARLMAASREPGLLELLEQLEGSLGLSGEQRALRWVLRRLRRARDERGSPLEELAG